jgi:hypothetical protein
MSYPTPITITGEENEYMYKKTLGVSYVYPGAQPSLEPYSSIPYILNSQILSSSIPGSYTLDASSNTANPDGITNYITNTYTDPNIIGYQYLELDSDTNGNYISFTSSLITGKPIVPSLYNPNNSTIYPYQIIVWKYVSGTFTQISSSDQNNPWIFDTTTGYLTFTKQSFLGQTSSTTNGTNPYISLWVYTGETGININDVSGNLTVSGNAYINQSLGVTGTINSYGGIKCSSIVGITGYTTPNSSWYGATIEINTSTNINQALPSATANGASIYVWNNSATPQIISSLSGKFSGYNVTKNSASYTIPSYTMIEFRSDNSSWYALTPATEEAFYMDNYTAQTIGGIKTFTSAPVMSGATITSATIPSSALVTSGVTGNTYNNATITVNSQGIITGASSGTTSSTTGNYSNPTISVSNGIITSASSGTTSSTTGNYSNPTIGVTNGIITSASSGTTSSITGNYTNATIGVTNGIITSASSGSSGSSVTMNSLTANSYIVGTTSTTGTVSNLYYQSSVYLTSAGQVNATSFNSSSDYRIKKDVKPIDDEYTVDNLNPVMYTNNITNGTDMGFIAHEVQEHFPFIVSGKKDGEHNQTINYISLIALLTKEIQDLKKRITILEKKE